MFTKVYTFQNAIFTAGYERNFEKATSFFSTTQGVPYDYDSVMHYSSHAFSTNDQATITPRDKSVKLSRLGQREGFSHNDVLHVKALYCPGEEGRSLGFIIAIFLAQISVVYCMLSLIAPNV